MLFASKQRHGVITVFRPLPPRAQEGLDGPTVARLAAHQRMRPPPYGPASLGPAAPGGSLAGRAPRAPPSRSDTSHYTATATAAGGGGGRQASSGQGGGASGPPDLNPVAAALPDWWHADPALRPPAGAVARVLEAAAGTEGAGGDDDASPPLEPCCASLGSLSSLAPCWRGQNDP